jgi:hypothetical protein
VAGVSKEVRGTVTQLSMSHEGYQVTVQFDVPHLDNLRVGKSLIVTLPEAPERPKPAV